MEKANKNKSYSVAFLLSLALVTFMIIGVYAGANYLSANIESNYSSGDSIRGNVRITFSNHAGDALFTSNFLGNITLRDLILNQTSGLVEGTNYTCTTEGCVNDYFSSETITDLTLRSGEANYIGFKADGPGIEIRNASLRIESNALASCTPNLYVDLLSDGTDLLTSSQSSGESCGIKHTGCYDQLNSAEAELEVGKEYCEKITLPAAPSFLVGGEIRKGNGDSNLTMKIYDGTLNSFLGKCKLPQNNQPLEELKCEINYSSHSTRDYHVCISTSWNNGYKVGWETSPPTCGTALGFSSFNSDFDLFAETIKYSASPTLIINESTYKKASGLSLRQTIDAYIQNHYNGNCQESSCFIPLKLYGDDQLISLNDVRLIYQNYGVSGPVSETIHKLRYDAPKISAQNISMDLSKANFVIPITSTENKFKLYLDNDLLFQKNVSIRRSFTFDVNPKFVAFGQNAMFFASSSTNITRTTWNFGDGTAQQTVNGTFISHSYVGRNNSFYNVTVTAYSNQTQATKQFTITIGDPRIVANQTISKYRKSLTNITSQINSYPSWAVQRIQKMIRLSNITSELDSIEVAYRASTTEQQYQEVMLDLIALNVPSKIMTTQSGDKIHLGVGYENMNINYLEQIENKPVADKNSLSEQVSAWMNDNFNPEISFKAISRINEFGGEVIATLFTITTNPTSYSGQKAYLIIGQDIEKVGEYKTNYNPSSISGSGIDYFTITQASQTFEFIIDGEFNAQNIGAYIAPSIDVIGSIEPPSGECYIDNICSENENAKSCPEDCSKKWFKFTIIWWILLTVFAFIAYIILQEWYKKDYQNSLFPDKNDLYNIVNFIYSARKSGLNDFEIKTKLRQQKWSGEKINFAFNKIEGKRTGMFEIPLFTKREHKNTIEQISNRQPTPVDARFIKRPSY